MKGMENRSACYNGVTKGRDRRETEGAAEAEPQRFGALSEVHQDAIQGLTDAASEFQKKPVHYF